MMKTLQNGPLSDELVAEERKIRGSVLLYGCMPEIGQRFWKFRDIPFMPFIEGTGSLVVMWNSLPAADPKPREIETTQWDQGTDKLLNLDASQAMLLSDWHCT